MNLRNRQACCSRRSEPSWTVAVLVVLFIHAGCSSITAADGGPGVKSAPEFTKTLKHEGIERTYHIRLPSEFSKDKPAPLVLALHGSSHEGRSFDQNTTQGTLTAAADKRGVVLVFPQGIDKKWCDGRTEILKAKKANNDAGVYQ